MEERPRAKGESRADAATASPVPLPASLAPGPGAHVCARPPASCCPCRCVPGHRVDTEDTAPGEGTPPLSTSNFCSDTDTIGRCQEPRRDAQTQAGCSCQPWSAQTRGRRAPVGHRRGRLFWSPGLLQPPRAPPRGSEPSIRLPPSPQEKPIPCQIFETAPGHLSEQGPFAPSSGSAGGLREGGHGPGAGPAPGPVHTLLWLSHHFLLLHMHAQALHMHHTHAHPCIHVPPTTYMHMPHNHTGVPRTMRQTRILTGLSAGRPVPWLRGKEHRGSGRGR